MIYQKNVPVWERMMRAVAGSLLIVLGLTAMHGTVWGYLVALSGVVAAVTGFVGFCPMCALAGRKIAANRPRV